MRQNDELHLEHPFAGSRMLRDMLKRESHPIGRKHVATLMKKMRIEALYKKPNTSGRHRVHPVYPYLLRNMEITRPNHVFVADITYIPIKRGFVYLFVAMAEICLCNGTATVQSVKILRPGSPWVTYRSGSSLLPLRRAFSNRLCRR
jgi:hypothetical protein